MHTAILVGTAGLLMKLKANGRHTATRRLPAEEALGERKRCWQTGLYSRFPRPDFALSFSQPELPVGKVASARVIMLGLKSWTYYSRPGGHWGQSTRPRIRLYWRPDHFGHPDIISREIDQPRKRSLRRASTVVLYPISFRIK